MPKYTFSWWIRGIFSPLKFNHTECDGHMTKYTFSWRIPSIFSPLKLNHTEYDGDTSCWCIPSILSPLKLNHTEWDGDIPKYTFSLGIPWIFSPLKLNHTEWKKRLSVQVLPLMTLDFTQALWSCKSEIVKKYPCPLRFGKWLTAKNHLSSNDSHKISECLPWQRWTRSDTDSPNSLSLCQMIHWMACPYLLIRIKYLSNFGSASLLPWRPQTLARSNPEPSDSPSWGQAAPGETILGSTVQSVHPLIPHLTPGSPGFVCLSSRKRNPFCLSFEIV